MYTATSTYEDFIKASNRVHTYNNYGGKYVEYNTDITILKGSGSISSSIKEMANWLNFQLDNGKFQGKQIISAKNLLETRKTQMVMKDSAGKITSYYCLGWMMLTGKSKGIIMHYGNADPSKTLVAFNPTQKWGVAIVSNEGNYGLGFNNSLFSAFAQIYNYGKIINDIWPTSKASAQAQIAQYYQAKKEKPTPPLKPAQKISAYTGTYYSKCYGQIVVKSNRTGLKIYLGNNKSPINLEHWNGNTYRVNYPITSSAIYSNVDFKLIKNGKAQAVDMKNFDKPGRNGTFIRTT